MKKRIMFSLFIYIFIQGLGISGVLSAAEPQNSEGAVVSGHELTIAEVLLAAEALSPELKAAAAREAQAHNDIEIGKSYYYPSLDVEGIESYGFAGSNGELNIGGLTGSPFRSGLAGGFVSRVNIFDLTRDFHLKTTHSLLKAAEAQTRIIRYQVDLAALRIYFDCMRYRGQAEVWQDISGQINPIVKDVEGLVKTGQHSPVDLMLIRTQ
ncbi:MAG: TolC family protein, partial [Candidatus Omnitrophica bacterium]|nr:TolC family protein [Candidatus Omnitrophota bacterium]